MWENFQEISSMWIAKYLLLSGEEYFFGHTKK